MDDKIVAGGDEETALEWEKLTPVPMKVGDATLFIRPTGQLSSIDDEIYTVAPSPDEVFQNTIRAIKECVRSIGEGIADLGAALKPEGLTVEFSVTFDAKGKASIVPFFVTSEAEVQTGLKVTATWHPGTTGSSKS